jgi:hypothetical protein
MLRDRVILGDRSVIIEIEIVCQRDTMSRCEYGTMLLPRQGVIL